MKISVTHIRFGCTHYCAREKNYKLSLGKNISILGNPFFLKDESQRDIVINNYEKYFNNEILVKNNIKMIQAVNEIYHDYLTTENVKLGCFCYPKKCHCDVIKKFIINMTAPIAIKEEEEGIKNGKFDQFRRNKNKR